MKRPKVFYGYWIVLVAFLCLFLFGGLAYSFSLFVKPLEASFGWGRGEIMLAFAIFYLTQAMASPFIGRMVDRYVIRWVISIGALVAGLGYIMLSQMDHLWQFYLGYAVIGIGLTASLGTVNITAWSEINPGVNNTWSEVDLAA